MKLIGTRAMQQQRRRHLFLLCPRPCILVQHERGHGRRAEALHRDHDAVRAAFW